MNKVLSISVFLFISILTSTICMEKENNGSKPGVDQLLILTPGVYYQPTVIQFNPNEDRIKSTSETFLKAQKQCPKGSQKTDSFREGLCLYRDLAVHGHVPSILALGNICFDFKNYFGALKWYVYGFQIHWLSTGEHNAKALDCLKKGGSSANVKKSKYFELFSKKQSQFLTVHPKGKHKEYLALLELELFYEKNGEKYLPTEERLTKAAWFGDFYFEHHATPKQQYAEGMKRTNKNQALRALKNFQRSQTPEALYMAGLLHVMGRVGTINGQIDYKTAADLFTKANTLEAHYSLGWIIHFGHFGLSEEGKPNYQEAAKHYMLSGNNSQALCHLGLLYEDGYLSEAGSPNYIEAAQYYLASKHPNAWYNLGKLIRDGHVRLQDGKVHLKGEETLVELQAAYEQAAICLEKSDLPTAKNDLAILYIEKEIRMKNGRPDIATGMHLYESANIPIAFLNLGCNYLKGIHNEKREPDYKKAYWNFLKAEKEIKNSEDSDINYRFYYPKMIQKRFQIIKFFYPEISDLFKKSSQEKELKNLYDTITNIMPSLKPSDQEFMSGLLAFSRDGDQEKALFHFTKSLTLGHSDANYYIECIQTLIKLEATEAKKQEQLKLQELEITEEPLVQPPSPDSSIPKEKEEEEDEPMVLEMPKTGVPSHKEKLKTEPTVVEKPKREKPERKALSYQERVEKALEKLKRKIQSKSKSFQSIQKVEPLATLNITFLDETVKDQYNAIQNLKLQEVLEDIHEKPFATSGVGKPEVLLGKYKGYKGCISRRLSGEDRLVYKVIGPREIIILSCKGHYE